MNYSIETLAIELHKLKDIIRVIERMQDEMYQAHPSLDSYRNKKEELESAIKILKRLQHDELDNPELMEET